MIRMKLIGFGVISSLCISNAFLLFHDHCSSSLSSSCWRPTTTTTTTTTRKRSSSKCGFWWGQKSMSCRSSSSWYGKKKSSDDNDDDDIDISDMDWRAFRAKLVMQPDGSTSSSSSPSSSSQEEAAATNDDGDGSLSTALHDEEDLDGIGAVFSSSFASSSVETNNSDDTTSSKQQQNQQQKQKQQQQEQWKFTPLDPSQWAYDSGKVIEKGAVILGGVEQEFGFGLRQQYFHKAAILVLDHDVSFTKGIILNRPSDWTLDDDINIGLRWRVWFGGDVQGLDSSLPDIVCLHSINDNERVVNASVQIMKDIQWTTFENAKKLVKVGAATPEDFWVFAGYAGWGPNQLMGELDRKSWYMVATDSQTLLKELARQQASGVDPRDAGLDVWELLMTMIGRQKTAEDCSGDFDDLMLKEWARDRLWSVGHDNDDDDNDRGDATERKKKKKMGPRSSAESGAGLFDDEDDDDDGKGKGGASFLSRLTKKRSSSSSSDSATPSSVDKSHSIVAAGSLVRASSAHRSPFLLSRQEYHKSVILVISDDEHLTVGVVLNLPATKGLEIEISSSSSSTNPNKRTVTLPFRYGGEYAVKGESPLLWLHCDARLREAGIGSGFDGDPNGSYGIWRCTQDDATNAIRNGIANPDDFLVISGVSVWTKGGGGGASQSDGMTLMSLSSSLSSSWGGGMQGEVDAGNFEIVPTSQIKDVWIQLIMQKVLTNINFKDNMECGYRAWDAAGGEKNILKQTYDEKKKDDDDDDDIMVFKTDTRVSDLSDGALRNWVATFLLGLPSLGGR